jgi:hypothetical protein
VTISCEWEEDAEGNWETDCGHMFVLNEGTPSGNKMGYCCYCGKSLTEKVYRENPNED